MKASMFRRESPERTKTRAPLHFGVESLALLANRVSIFVQLLEAEALIMNAAGLDKDSERNISPEGFFEK